MTRKPFIAHSELTNEIYIIVGKEKYCVTEQVIKAVKATKALEQEDILDKIRAEIVSLTYALESYMAYKDGETAERYRQIAEWLKELKRLTALSNAIQDTVEELNHIATEPYDVDDYQEGVTDGIQLAIRTINKKINERTNSGDNVTNEEIEEAIDLLDNLIGMVEDNHKSDYDKAIKMGIEALKRLSNTSNDERR